MDVPHQFHELLDSTAVALVGTLGRRGEPQVTPIWFLWDEGVVRMSLVEGRQKLRNLRLAVRLGIAFGALALGLAIVATVAFVSADSTQSSIDTPVHRSVRATALDSDLEVRSHDIAHGVSQHLYVFDGDLSARTRSSRTSCRCAIRTPRTSGSCPSSRRTPRPRTSSTRTPPPATPSASRT